MTGATDPTTGTDDAADGALAELHAWLREAWDPALSLREWWQRLADSGWSQPHWPTEWYGRGLARSDVPAVVRTIRRFGAVTAPVGFATNLAGPTLLVHGTPEQCRRHLPGMVNGTDAYCQLFSEPNAGSDLAGLQCRAERDGDHWVVNGQKVWTSGGQIANKAILVARTNVDVPKHAGISYFIIDVRQPGIEIRPLREMTGRAFFNEVFITDARVPAEDLIGGEGNGWAVANTTLAFERALSGDTEAGATADPGPIAGNLDLPVERFARPDGQGPAGGDEASEASRAKWPTLTAVARRLGRAEDPLVRDALMRLYAMEQVIDLNSRRGRDLERAGGQLPGLPNLAKMAQNHALRLARDLTFAILGPAGTCFAYDEEGKARLASEVGVDGLVELVEAALFAQGPSIYGGSDQIQRNIVGDRILGLPREPSVDKGVPFRDLLRN